jgi:predicted small secreted protein
MTPRIAALSLSLFLLAACNVDRDAGNDTTTLSVNENQVEETVGDAGNLVEGAADEVQEAARNAAPVVEDAARDVGNAAERAGERIDNGADRAAAEVRDETRDNPPRQ